MSGINTLPDHAKKKWMSYFGWSVSRQNLMDTCPKAYYYRYIHSWRIDWKERDNFQILRDLQAVPLIHGIHISDILRKVLDKEISSEIESLKARFEREMRETFEKGEERVTELYNGVGIADDYFEEHIEAGKKEIENFITEIYPFVKDMDIRLVDRIDKYEIERRNFYSAPDFLGIDEKGVWHLADWKTGKGVLNESFLDLQLTTYAYYAIKRIAKGSRPKMRLYAIFLQDMSKNVKKDLTEKMLQDAKDRMFRMHDDVLERSMNGPFPALPDERKCRFCNFATICEEGKYFLNDRQVRSLS